MSIPAVPVEQPKCDVTGLLNLDQRNAASNRMNGAGPNGDHVANARGNRVQTLLDRAGREMPFECDSINAGIQADRQAAVGSCGQNEPRFRFALLSGNECRRLRVVWMNLNRHRFGSIEEFEQQRKLLAARVTAKQFVRMLTYQIVQRASVEETALDSALVVAEINDLPTFRPTGCVGIWLAPQLGQSLPAPRALFEHRLQLEWRHRAKSGRERKQCLLVSETRDYSPPPLFTVANSLGILSW